MSAQEGSPFDDASGQEFLKWFSTKGGAYSAVFEVETAGTTAADAGQAFLGTNIVRTTVAGAGLIAPAGVPIGALFLVINGDSTHSMKLWPPSSDINMNVRTNTPGAAETIGQRVAVYFQRISATEFVREP